MRNNFEDRINREPSEIKKFDPQIYEECRSVILANACTNPWAVMVVCPDTTITIFTMLCANWLIKMACSAVMEFPSLMSIIVIREFLVTHRRKLYGWEGYAKRSMDLSI
jgi:hypothetical protein